MTAQDFARLPLTQWQHTAEDFDPTARGELSDDAGEYAVRFARAAAYLNARYLGASHDRAVDAQNRVAKALRKALGFTYPQADITF